MISSPKLFRITALGLVTAIGIVTWNTQAVTANGAQLPELPIRGIVRPVNRSAIAIDLPVRVAKLHFREAQAFRKGDILISFDCERFAAEHRALVAAYREQKLQLKSQAYLNKLNAVGRVEVAISRARADKAKAEAAALAARLKQCRFIAPYDGRVTRLSINEHEIPATSKPFMRIVDESAFEIELIVPSLWLKTLRPDQVMSFTVDETGQEYAARVDRIGAAVDPVSQTVRVTAVFTNPDKRVLAGMSGSAKFTGAPGASQ